MTLESLVRTVAVEKPRLSPDGTRVAFVARDSLDPTLHQIWLVDAAGNDRPRPFTAGGRSAREPVWSPDSRQLLFLSAGSDTSPEQIRLIDVPDGTSRELTGEPGGVVLMQWSPDGSRIAYVTPGLSRAETDPIDLSTPPPAVRLRVRDVETGTTRTISPDSSSVWNLAWSPDSKRLAVTFTRSGRFGEWRRGRLALVREDGKEWTRLPGRADPLAEPAFSPDGARLAYYALSGSTDGYSSLHVVDGSDGEPVRLVPPEWKGTDEGVSWTRSAGLIVTEFQGVHAGLSRVDPETGRHERLAERWTRPGSAARSFSVSTGGAVAFASSGPGGPDDIFILDPDGGPPRRLTSMNRQLEGLDLPVPKPITWTSSDGLPVEGLLLLPSGAPAVPLPLIVQPHGGPSSHWSLSFFDDPHYPGLLLASRGFAVLYPNPRGSTGYGEEFKRLNYQDLGGGDLADVMSGIDSLVAAGVADGSRIGIGGFSYGGYLSAWAVCQSDRFRCAVVGAGPTNFTSASAQTDLAPYWNEEFFGVAGALDPARYAERSPLTYVNQIHCPILLLHGAEDTRIPMSQSYELFTALKETGKPVEFYVYPREGHGVREPAHLLDLGRRQLQWFERYLK